ncbi:D-hexose-6-phosphate mutarotase [Ursidibacter arcticus]|uniref:D-hexose-6-phosphate mutarotase n=1 Tax=Ursidibacter arcticus TaxID=1524965 RepID=UPI0012F7930B|nr:D-hexose-6-phosphate mutarotase [Ursidibacter arcticus]KAE9536912.1 D-hexose-6-phosphate mutarotase [Ursidibacter arcticus]
MSQSFPPDINVVTYNQIPVVEVNHPKCRAKISLQGAQLFSWQPEHCKQDVLWLSEIEPFVEGNAIRGGIPICYPWFGGVKQPAHGFARLRFWALSQYQITDDGVELLFKLDNDAQIKMRLNETCTLTFTHFADEPAQLALHSYFNVADIEQVAVFNLPDNCFNSLTQQQQAVSSPRKITENVDEIYSAEKSPSVIADQDNHREISVEHINASQIVVWNPWHKATSSMSEQGYRTMLCIETARISSLLAKNEQVSVKISVKSN